MTVERAVTPRSESTSPWAAGAWILAVGALLAAVVARYEIARNGTALHPSERLAAALLWWVLSCPGWIGAGIGGALLLRLVRRCVPATIGAAILVWLACQFVFLVAVHVDLIGGPEALLATLLVAALLGLRLRRPITSADAAAALFAAASLLATSGSGPLPSTMPVIGECVLLLLLALAVGGLLRAVLGAPGKILAAALVVLVPTAFLAALGPGGSSAPLAREAGPGNPPHVVLIVLDTQRRDHLGTYGGHLETPQFDRLAASSVVFDQAFSPASWTVPSHASLFTGLSPVSHGCSFRQHRHLDDSFTTIAEALGAVGYQTAAFASNGYLRLAHLDQGFEVFREPGARFRTLQLRRLTELLGFPDTFADQGAADAVAMLEEYLRGERSLRPQFLFVNLLEPHWRYLPSIADRMRHLPEGVDLLRATRLAIEIYGPLLMAGQPLGGPVHEVLRGFYAAAVEYQDRRLGEVMGLLEEALGTENTLLVVTADHGENLGEAGRYDHVFAVNDHLVHVPLLMRAPVLGLAGGTRRDDLVQLMDVPATIAAAVSGVDWPATAGTDLFPAPTGREFVVIEGDPYLAHLERMARFTGMQRDVGRFAETLHAIRDRRYKYVLTSGGREYLYDTATDPDEAIDLLPGEAERAAALRAQLAEWSAAQPRYVPADEAELTTLSNEERAQLESLGYLHR